MYHFVYDGISLTLCKRQDMSRLPQVDTKGARNNKSHNRSYQDLPIRRMLSVMRSTASR